MYFTSLTTKRLVTDKLPKNETSFAIKKLSRLP